MCWTIILPVVFYGCETWSLTCREEHGGGNTLWRSYFRHCATSRKVAGSIPDSIIGIFRWPNPSSCTINDPGVDSAFNRTEYQVYFLGGKGSRCVGLTTLPPSCADFLEICGPQTHGDLEAYTEIALPCYIGWGRFKMGCLERYLGIRRTR